MDLQNKYIEKLKNEQIFLDIYTDRYEESDFGFVIDYNDEFVVIEKFDSDGNYDGISILIRDNISRIRWGGNEITNTSKLIEIQKRQKDKIAINLTSIETILHSINKLFGSITVHIQDLDNGVCFIGQIEEMDQDSIVIHEFGSKASMDRKFILLSLNDITRIDAGGQYENNLSKLFGEKNNVA